MGFIELNDIVPGTCNCYSFSGNLTPFADAQKVIQDLINSGKTFEQAMDEMGYLRLCCRNNMACPFHFQLRDAPPLAKIEGKGVNEKIDFPVPYAKKNLDYP